MDWYRGKTVLITGASSGIGEQMARLLAPAGARLLLTARSVEPLGKLAAECRAAGAEAHVFPLDLAQRGAAEKLYETVTAAGQEVDVLINNAGYGMLGLFSANDVDLYEDMITLNVTNLVSLTRLALPGMIARGRGGIMNVASTAAFQPVPKMAVYGATKAFVKEFTQAVHAELKGSGVHVTCLCPGPTSTPFLSRANQKKVPGGRPAATAVSVAVDGLDSLARNRRLRVTGVLNRLASIGAQIVPSAITIQAARLMMESAE